MMFAVSVEVSDTSGALTAHMSLASSSMRKSATAHAGFQSNLTVEPVIWTAGCTELVEAGQSRGAVGPWSS